MTGKRMKIAIMGAMPEEIAPILEQLKEYKTTRYANNNYYEANYRGIVLVIAYFKIGKVFVITIGKNFLTIFFLVLKVK